MNISDEELDRVFRLADEVSEIERKLADGFQELSFLFYADDVLAWLARNHELIIGALRVSPRDELSGASLSSRRSDILFHFGNYLASAQAGIDFLYNYGKSGRFTEGLLKDVTSRTDSLKKCAPQRVLTALRNRMVHCPPLLDTLYAEARTIYHSEGEGAHLCAVMTDAAITNVDEQLPKERLIRDLWDDIKLKNQSRKDWLSPLLAKHRSEVGEAFGQIKQRARDEYSTSYDEYQRLLSRRNELETELAKPIRIG